MIRLVKPYITFEEVEPEFREIFASGWFTRGKYVTSFVDEIRRYTGAEHAFLTTSATTALWTCLRVLGVGPGDEVVVSDYSFPATSNVVEDVGATPVFADVDLDTFNMLPEELEQKITPRTKAVIFVDAFGNPTGLHAIQAICKRRNVPLIEDAACALGSFEADRPCGRVADLTCFSFHPRKLLTTGEGGAITTGNSHWAERLEVKLAHGARVHDGTPDFIDFGYNFRMTELQAVMGIKQLRKLDDIVKQRNQVRAGYVQGLEPLGFRVQKMGPSVRHNVQSLVFRTPQGVARDRLITHLKSVGIEATLGTYCLSGTSFSKQKYKEVQKNAWELFETSLTLPCYAGVDVQYVVEAIAQYFASP